MSASCTSTFTGKLTQTELIYEMDICCPQGTVRFTTKCGHPLIIKISPGKPEVVLKWSPSGPLVVKYSVSGQKWSPSDRHVATKWYLGYHQAGLHKLWYPGIRDTSTWSKFGAHGEHGDVFLFSNLGVL